MTWPRACQRWQRASVLAAGLAGAQCARGNEQAMNRTRAGTAQRGAAGSFTGARPASARDSLEVTGAAGRLGLDIGGRHRHGRTDGGRDTSGS
jgi:hypothetical protein